MRPHHILVTDSVEVAHGDVLRERQQAPHDVGLLITDTAQDVDVEPQLLAGEWVVTAAVVKADVSGYLKLLKAYEADVVTVELCVAVAAAVEDVEASLVTLLRVFMPL